MRITRTTLATGVVAVALLISAGMIATADQQEQPEPSIETDVPETALPGENITVTTQAVVEDESVGITFIQNTDLQFSVTDKNFYWSIGGEIIDMGNKIKAVQPVKSNFTNPLQYKMESGFQDVEPGDKAFIYQEVGSQEVNKTIEIVEPSVDYYRTDDGEVTLDSVLHAVENWRWGVIETALLRDVVDEWRAAS